MNAGSFIRATMHAGGFVRAAMNAGTLDRIHHARRQLRYAPP